MTHPSFSSLRMAKGGSPCGLPYMSTKAKQFHSVRFVKKMLKGVQVEMISISYELKRRDLADSTL